jgi:hypothetical protein
LLVGSGGSLLLLGCPQLLDDDFNNRLRPDASIGIDDLDSGTPPSLPTNVTKSDAGPQLGPPHPPPPAPPGTPDAGTDAGPDAAALPGDPDLVALRNAIVHRYDFEGTGTTATDRVGTANGTLYGATLTGQGQISFNGSNQYINLPNGLVSASNDATIEAWLTWKGGADWQRVFDFGSSDSGEGARGAGVTFLYLVARSEYGVMQASYGLTGATAETTVNGTAPLPVGILTHLAVVVDSQHDALSLYMNGALDASTTLTRRLSSINDVNDWLGMSQFSEDPFLNADLTEFRIYDQALDASQVALSYRLGPDASLSDTP